MSDYLKNYADESNVVMANMTANGSSERQSLKTKTKAPKATATELLLERKMLLGELCSCAARTNARGVVSDGSLTSEVEKLLEALVALNAKATALGNTADGISTNRKMFLDALNTLNAKAKAGEERVEGLAVKCKKLQDAMSALDAKSKAVRQTKDGLMAERKELWDALDMKVKVLQETEEGYKKEIDNLEAKRKTVSEAMLRLLMEGVKSERAFRSIE